ncbi:MAG: hypothetical protein OEW68_04060 [Gammaproteobacteria bacterium]|nr:hypothetical protein [Gammaproteobacteria bacterium]
MTLSFGEFDQSVDLSVETDGSLNKVVFQRWSDTNATKTFQRQPFGGNLSKNVEFDGHRLPTHIDAGNFFGTDEYFPFYKVNVTSIRFPKSNGDGRN